jgi:hypothetical protein
MGVGGQSHALVALTPGNNPGTLHAGTCLGAGLVCAGAENIAYTGIRSHYHLASSESL